MPLPFLLSRVLLQFDQDSDDLLAELSAAAFTPDGYLWLGSDEFNTIERLTPLQACTFGDHKAFAVGDFIELRDEDEIDIEGLDFSEGYLWFVGSHSTKRSRAKGKSLEKDIERLSRIKTELNRYLLARIPVVNGDLLKASTTSEQPPRTAACLQQTLSSNILMEALKDDPHLGLYVTSPLPSKENGFDIEGLAAHGDRVFLGLRGPVLRGWSILLELEVEESQPGTLTLKAIGAEGRLYRKHFLHLNGLGIRELCWQGEDLLILAGPTMELEGAMQVFRFSRPLDQTSDSLTGQDSHHLNVLFDLPFTIGSDHAEGLALYSCFEQTGLLMVYDSPNPDRRATSSSIYADVFRVP